MNHTTRRRSQRLKEASERARNTSKDTPTGPVLFFGKVILDPFLTPLQWTCTGQKNAAKRVPGGQTPLVAVRLGHSEGWKPPKVGVCTWVNCPRIRDSVRLVRDTAIFWFQPAGHIRGPNEPTLEPTDTVSGSHGSKNSQKSTQTLPKLILSIDLDNGTFWGPPRRHRGPCLVILGHFGPAWGPTRGPPGARSLGSTELFGGRDTGLPGPKGSHCLSSQHHPGLRGDFLSSILGPLLLWGPPKTLRV